MKESFVVYNAIEEQTAILSDAQMGQLFRAMIRFNKGREPKLSDPLVAVSFSFIRPMMEKDRRKYEEVCAKRKEAGCKGGRPRKNQTAQRGDFLPENQMVFSKPDNVYVNDNDNDYDYDNDFFTRSARKEVLDSLDAQPAQNAQSGQTQDTQDGQTQDGDTRERAFQDALRYAEKMGYQFTAKQRRRLRQWCQRFPFDAVRMAIDRALYYGGKSVTYIFRVLQEWQDLGLRDEHEVTTYLEARERLAAVEGQSTA